MSTVYGGICPTCHFGAHGLHGGHCPNGGKPEAEWTTHEQREAVRRRTDPRVRAVLEDLRVEVAQTLTGQLDPGWANACRWILAIIDRRLA